VQELGGTTARQPAQADEQKYSIPYTSCLVYKWGLVGGQESASSLSLASFTESMSSMIAAGGLAAQSAIGR